MIGKLEIVNADHSKLHHLKQRLKKASLKQSQSLSAAAKPALSATAVLAKPLKKEESTVPVNPFPGTWQTQFSGESVPAELQLKINKVGDNKYSGFFEIHFQTICRTEITGKLSSKNKLKFSFSFSGCLGQGVLKYDASKPNLLVGRLRIPFGLNIGVLSRVLRWKRVSG
ncbi:MAG: hypothetical protein ACI9HY_003113 [Planctomycetaceae bacterium]